MGIVADLFVSTPAEAVQYEASASEGRAAHIARYKPAEYKRLTSLEFGTLWALILSEEWDVNKHMLEGVAGGEGGETWLCRFSAELVAALAGLTRRKQEAIAVAWAESEELAMTGFLPEHTKEVVEDLVRLAREAQAEGRELYLWGSL